MPPPTYDQEYLLRLIEIAVKAAMADGTKVMEESLTDVRDSVATINQRLERGDARMNTISADLASNTRSTEEMRDMFDVAKKGLRFMGWLGVGAKWLLRVGTPIAGLYALVRGFDSPSNHR